MNEAWKNLYQREKARSEALEQELEALKQQIALSEVPITETYRAAEYLGNGELKLTVGDSSTTPKGFYRLVYLGDIAFADVEDIGCA